MQHNRRKYDVTCSKINQQLWDKWLLESIEFYSFKDNELVAREIENENRNSGKHRSQCNTTKFTKQVA